MTILIHLDSHYTYLAVDSDSWPNTFVLSITALFSLGGNPARGFEYLGCQSNTLRISKLAVGKALNLLAALRCKAILWTPRGAARFSKESATLDRALTWSGQQPGDGYSLA